MDVFKNRTYNARTLPPPSLSSRSMYTYSTVVVVKLFELYSGSSNIFLVKTYFYGKSQQMYRKNIDMTEVEIYNHLYGANKA